MIEIEGLLTVPVPGTPIRLSSAIVAAGLLQGLVPDPTQFSCHACLVQAWHSNVGKTYIGKSNMVKGTGVGVSTVLAIPTSNSIPSFSAALTLAPAGIDLSNLWVDADTANDGVLVTVLVT